MCQAFVYNKARILKMEDIRKLKTIRQHFKLTQQQLADLCGVKQQLIAMMENGSRKPTTSFKLGFIKSFNIDFDDIRSEKDIEQDLKIITKPEICQDNIIAIPTHDISASAGAGVWVDREPEQDVLYFDKRFLKHLLKRDDFSSIHIIHAQGDSMDSGWNQPDDIRDGDLLMIDTSQTTGNNQVFVILVNNRELRVKRLTKRGDTLYITSNNPKYKEEIYRPDDTEIEVKVIGKVVWNGSKE